MQFPADPSGKTMEQDVMEGGLRLSETLAWARGKSGRELLELAMSLETDSYDLYIKMGKIITDSGAHKVFGLLIEEERHHLKRMSSMMDGLV